MRRGHPGSGGWRNENQRHFRPRTGGGPRFRPPQLQSLLETPRFPPLGPRPHRGPHAYNTHSEDHIVSEHHERNNYRNYQNNQRPPDRHQQRPRNAYSYVNPNLRNDDTSPNKVYNHPPFYQDVTVESFHVNSHGDVDHRQLGNVPPPNRLNRWTEPPPILRQPYEDRNYQAQRPKDLERPTERTRHPSMEYAGHRPPASDYYDSTSSTTTNNNNPSFSRPLGDTVDIVRKRLMNRNEPNTKAQDLSEDQTNIERDVNEMQHSVQELPAKRKIQRQRQNVKSNCDKMKSNIVNELFKMDKDKIHKLMDDPSSSSKFEYAISSLITESQNSLNRHMRSVAEQSLVSTSSDDFINNDNNTIYEDTFMKQMQCILDPQDTIFLEDIKPLVMAELSKVLQVNNLEQRHDTDEYNSHQRIEFDQSYENPNCVNFTSDELPPNTFRDIDQRIENNYDERFIANDVPIDNTAVDDFGMNEGMAAVEESRNRNVIFERRSSRRSDHFREDRDRRPSMENPRQRISTDNPATEDMLPITESTLPLFDSHAEQFSDEDETFAELDRQYHVAVDPNFLDDVSARTTPNYMFQVDMTPGDIKQEFSNQLFSSENLLPSVNNTNKDDRQLLNIKPEVNQSPDFPKENSTPVNTNNITSRTDYVDTKQEYATKSNERGKETETPKNSNISKTSHANSRKRSIDQRPSHRKEKRKKSESDSVDSNKPPIRKHDTDSSKDRHAKSSDKYKDHSKSYYSIFGTKHNTSKDISNNKRTDTSRKSYSDKYVKRKEIRKSNDQQPNKNRRSSASSQNILSVTDSSVNPNESPTKTDAKTKLKPIDMFGEQTKKVSVHQSHRNTAIAPVATSKAEEKAKPAQTPSPKIVQTKHVSTQVFKRVINKESQTVETKTTRSRLCQTDKPRQISLGVQTPRVFPVRPRSGPQDAFERMKEIDLEIQALLQEKFQLYNNLESGPPAEQSQPSYLSVTVVNVANMNQQEEIPAEVPEDPANIIATDHPPLDNVEPNIKMDPDDSGDLNANADDIVNDFANIPVEELEKIALETVDLSFHETKSGKKNTRHKKLQHDRINSVSPKSTSSRKSNKKAKTPNISLIEQIITDDRRLEDIICLDDLEVEDPPRKHKKKSHKTKPKKKSSKKSKSKSPIDISLYGLKECSVVLVRVDVNKYFKQEPQQTVTETVDTVQIFEEPPVQVKEPLTPIKECPIIFKDSPKPVENPEPVERPRSSEPVEIIEESVVNDLQFDMLDVSEDIVIGESCEIKDKDSNEQAVVINDELILDNSQSSADDAPVGEVEHVENECKTYDYSTDEELRRDSHTVTGNADAVLAIECIENNFLAACLDGNVYYFTSDGQLLNTMRGSNLAVTCLTIVHEKYGTTVYTGSLDSRIRYYDLETGLEKGPECNVLSPIQTMDRAWDTVFVGTRTGFVLQFECKNNMLIPVSTVKFSEQAILALRALKEGPRKVLLVASRSEDVTIKDAQTGLLLRTLSGPKMTVYTLLFEDGKVYCGTSSNQIHVFDYASGSLTGCHSGGKGAVCLRATGGLLFAGCYDGCVYVYREGERRPIAQLRGPSLMLLSLCVVGSKSGSLTGCHSGGKGAVCLRATGGLLFAGCYDGCVYVYREGERRPIAQLRGPSLMLLSLCVVGSKSGSLTGCHSGGKGAVCLRATGGLLFAGCYDGCVYVYREGERRPIAQLRGPSLMLLSLCVVGSKIIAGYKDRSLYIWKIPLSILQEMIL